MALTPRVHKSELPASALLCRYGDNGAFADCYVTNIDCTVTHAQFVAAFYTTWLFKLERFILRWLAGRPFTDTDAQHLAEGRADRFAAWTVEARDVDQLLLADFTGRTRSWLMAEAAGTPDAPRTRLYFGSAVVPKQSADGRRRLGFVFSALLGFHKLYSRMLLRAAHARLRRMLKRRGDAP